NVASLMLARAASREKEISIRVALGANRLRIVRQLLVEATLIALVAGMLGLLRAWGGTRMLTAAGPAVGLPRLDEISIDARDCGASGRSISCDLERRSSLGRQHRNGTVHPGQDDRRGSTGERRLETRQPALLHVDEHPAARARFRQSRRRRAR